MGTDFCPQCHQPMAEVRNGVRLPSLKARIYDVVRRAGIRGILLDDINAIVFDGHANPVTIRNHIRQLNDLLADTDVSISGRVPRGFYRIVPARDG
jgi:hypothetical protein